MYRVWALALDLIYLPLLSLILPLLYLKAEKYRKSLPRRFQAPAKRNSSAPCIWVHGVSVGEVKASKPFLDAFAQAYPNWEIVLSTTTNTGYEEALRLFPQITVFRFPLDLSWILHKTFKNLAPSLIVLMELELWPNFLLLARHHQTPVVVLNGRLSAKSFRHYRFARPLVSFMFQTVQLYLVQNQEYAKRFEALHISPERIQVTGNLKLDQKIPETQQDLRTLFQFDPQDLILVGGSTHPGENEILVEQTQILQQEIPHLRLILVPRHPEKVEEVVRFLEKEACSFIRWTKTGSRFYSGKTNSPIILVDQMGVLTDVYQIAHLVFVGKSLKAHGGQNMVEPLLLGKTTVVGPYTENFKEEMKFLRENGVIEEVQNEKELLAFFQHFFRAPSSSQGISARELLRQQIGATQRSLDALKQWGYL